MLLQGDGASVEAGVPDSSEMTKRIAETFHSRFDLRKYLHVISFATPKSYFDQLDAQMLLAVTTALIAYVVETADKTKT